MALTVGAIGVVYGDIGTSPLYAFRECFHGTHGLAVSTDNVLGVLSLNGIFACDRVLIPISADYLAINGALQVDKTLRALERVIKNPPMKRFVLTRFDSRRHAREWSRRVTARAERLVGTQGPPVLQGQRGGRARRRHGVGRERTSSSRGNIDRPRRDRLHLRVDHQQHIGKRRQP